MNDDSDELRERIRVLEGRLALVEALATKGDFPLFPVLIAKRTGSSTKQWKEQTVNDGVIEDFPDGRDCTSDGDEAAIVLPKDAIVLLQVEDGEFHRYVEISSNRFFPVTLATDGGGNGTRTTSAAFTYAVTNEASVSIGTHIAPEKAPRPNGAIVAATKGIAYYNAAGALRLWDTNEKFGTGAC